MSTELKSILLVDDEPQILEALSAALRGTGKYKVVCAVDGADAMRKAKNQRFDLVCTDYRMPKLNGAALISALRSEVPDSAKAVVLMTGFAEEARRDCEARRIGNVVVIEKPVAPEQLLELVAKLVPDAPAKAKPETRLSVEFINPFIDAVIQTLTTLGQVAKIEKRKPYLVRKGDELSADISGTIAIESPQFKGTLSICLPTQTFLGIVQKMLGETHAEINAENQDAAAELTNVIYGQTKTVLNAKGFQLQEAIPKVVRGNARNGGIVTPFETEVGKFFVLVSH